MEQMIDSLKDQVSTLETLLEDEVNSKKKQNIKLTTKMTNSLQDLAKNHFLEVERITKFNSFLKKKSKKDTFYMLNVLEKNYKAQKKNISDEKSVTEAALRNHKTIVADEMSKLWEEKIKTSQYEYAENLVQVARSTKDEMLKLHEDKVQYIKELHEKEVHSLNQMIEKREQENEIIQSKLIDASANIQNADLLTSEIQGLKKEILKLHVNLENADNIRLMKEKEIEQLHQTLAEERLANARRQSIALRNKQWPFKLSDNSDSEAERSSSSSSGSPNNKPVKQVQLLHQL